MVRGDGGGRRVRAALSFTTLRLMGAMRIRVWIADQRLDLLSVDEVVASYPVSTAAKGVGERDGSEQTPGGLHEVSEKIGVDTASGTVFVGREPTGEICTPERFEADPHRDWILTRILWLQGLEPGSNRGGNVDTRSRYIYIHGSPNESELGTPASHGCIRMRNEDVIDLFDRVEVGTPVEIG